jgi:hypothetical protein
VTTDKPHHTHARHVKTNFAKIKGPCPIAPILKLDAAGASVLPRLRHTRKRWTMRSSSEFDESESRPRHLSSDAEQLLPTDPLAEDPTPAIPFVEGQQLTPRAIIVGLVIGTLACFSNSYFGLQTGWISMMSLPLSLLGFAVFKAFSAHLSYPFSPVENVLVQTVAVAVGTLPVGAGLVGIIPALEKLLLPEEGGPLDLGYGRLVIWSMGVAFFGVFFAVPLRRQVIIREK